LISDIIKFSSSNFKKISGSFFNRVKEEGELLKESDEIGKPFTMVTKTKPLE